MSKAGGSDLRLNIKLSGGRQPTAEQSREAALQ
jgi:hypothetical protein